MLLMGPINTTIEIDISLFLPDNLWWLLLNHLTKILFCKVTSLGYRKPKPPQQLWWTIIIIMMMMTIIIIVKSALQGPDSFMFCTVASRRAVFLLFQLIWLKERKKKSCQLPFYHFPFDEKTKQEMRMEQVTGINGMLKRHEQSVIFNQDIFFSLDIKGICRNIINCSQMLQPKFWLQRPTTDTGGPTAGAAGTSTSTSWWEKMGGR